MLDEHHDNKPADNNDRVQSLTEIRKFQVHDGKKGTNDIKIIKKELNFAGKRLSYYKKVNKQIQDDYIRVSNKISELEVALETSSKAMALVEKIKRNSCIDREIDIQTAGYLFTDVREIHAKSHLRGFRIHSAWQYTIQTPFSTEFLPERLHFQQENLPDFVLEFIKLSKFQYNINETLFKSTIVVVRIAPISPLKSE